MSDKRFEIRKNINGEYWLFDNKYDKAIMISKIRATLLDVCNMLNEQQATISALKDIFKDIVNYSKWDSEKPYCSLGIAVDRKTYYKIREILNE